MRRDRWQTSPPAHRRRPLIVCSVPLADVAAHVCPDSRLFSLAEPLNGADLERVGAEQAHLDRSYTRAPAALIIALIMQIAKWPFERSRRTSLAGVGYRKPSGGANRRPLIGQAD